MNNSIQINREKKPGAGRLRRPMTALAVSYIAGVLLGLSAYRFAPAFSTAAAIVFVFTVAFCAYCGFCPSQNRFVKLLRTLLIHGTVLLAAATYTCIRALPAPEHALADIMQKPREGLEIRGVVKGPPVSMRGWSKDRLYLKFPVRLAGIRRVPEWQKAAGVVTVVLAGETDQLGPPVPDYGDEWVFAGVMRDNSPGVDGEELPLSRRVGSRYTFSGNMNEARLVSKGHGSFVWKSILTIQKKCADILSEGLEDRPEISAVLRAVLIGQRADLPEEIGDSLLKTGTFHIMAISGLHVGIVAVLAAGFLRVLGVSKRRWFLFVAPVVVFYVMIAGMRPSAVRAGIMVTVFFAGPFFGRKPDAPSALALAAVLALLYNPLQIMEIGFLLSFATVGILLLLCPPIFQAAKNRLEGDPVIISDERGWFKKTAHGVSAAFFSVVVVSSVAWIASTPLSAFFFNRIAPSGLIVNPVIIPLVFIIVLIGMVSLGLGFVCPVLSAVLNTIQILPVSLFFKIIGFGSVMPLGFLNVRSPPPLMVAGWYAGLACSVLLPGRKKRFAFAGLVSAALWVGAYSVQNWRTVYTDVVPAGKASVLFMRGMGVNMLFNTGSPFYARKVAAHLKKQGVNSIDKVVVTAGDYQSVGGFFVLAESYPVDKMIFFKKFRANSSGGRAFELAQEKGVQTHVLDSKHEIGIPGVESTSGALSAQSFVSCSSAFVFNYDGIRVLVLNSAGTECLPDIAEKFPGQHADIVITADRNVARLFCADPLEKKGSLFLVLSGDRVRLAAGYGVAGRIQGGSTVVCMQWDEFARLVLKGKNSGELRVMKIK